MKTIIIAATSFFALAFAASAFSEGEDANGDGMLSMDELSSAYSDVDEILFAAIDTNGDGGISEEELAAATDAGVITKNSG